MTGNKQFLKIFDPFLYFLKKFWNFLEVCRAFSFLNLVVQLFADFFSFLNWSLVITVPHKIAKLSLVIKMLSVNRSRTETVLACGSGKKASLHQLGYKVCRRVGGSYC